MSSFIRVATGLVIAAVTLQMVTTTLPAYGERVREERAREYAEKERKEQLRRSIEEQTA
eukprot:CAMPEP_0198328948 /NCGR_PEP_ID=MMETSP1450-20131203/15833_1 /TAXON_ID=753684 ORGANISM="Madagascaria erythrocladiodes, Strain CCMP3234" /NCGR_SAMPLE_ID=MMETSP1450 /ASSEMBLY_ACC=CAM_ASM_001115 /LENGTH=58 /DNA_ID=CAMNT_0044033113 /DNA_START=19 /DNA_END=195 /DNA_ORIENTATION=-